MPRMTFQSIVLRERSQTQKPHTTPFRLNDIFKKSEQWAEGSTFVLMLSLARSLSHGLKYSHVAPGPGTCAEVSLLAPWVSPNVSGQTALLTFSVAAAWAAPRKALTCVACSEGKRGPRHRTILISAAGLQPCASLPGQHRHRPSSSGLPFPSVDLCTR